jgi:hypothetical protein
MMANVVGSSAAGVGIAFLFIVYFVVIIGSLAMMVVALVDIVRRPEWQWKIAGQEKILWLLLVILINIFAIPSLIYWFGVRKKLIVVEEAAAAGRYGPGRMTYGGWEPGPPESTPYPGLAAPGWQPDPSDRHQYRWWDGSRWTEHTWSEVPARRP